jgi:hypothetical protein
MLTKNKLNPEKKLETQQRIIEQFEKEKAQLLDAIETLTFEKEFDKENNMESIKLAKSLIESMEKQMATMAECIDELNVYKAEYKKCIRMLKDSLRKHSLHMHESLHMNESLHMKDSLVRKGATQ